MFYVFFKFYIQINFLFDSTTFKMKILYNFKTNVFFFAINEYKPNLM